MQSVVQWFSIGLGMIQPPQGTSVHFWRQSGRHTGGCVLATQLCPTICNSMECLLEGLHMYLVCKICFDCGGIKNMVLHKATLLKSVIFLFFPQSIKGKHIWPLIRPHFWPREQLNLLLFLQSVLTLTRLTGSLPCFELQSSPFLCKNNPRPN